ncbi:MAG: hypothetical protein ABL903_18020 [Methylococcales bacterium]
MKTVLLSDKTVGITENDIVEIGDSITAYLQDANGTPCSVYGVVEDILDLQFFHRIAQRNIKLEPLSISL